MIEASKHLQPLVEERKAQMAEYGADWDDRPASTTLDVCVICLTFVAQNDLLQWFLEHPDLDQSLFRTTKRMLAINLAAIHTSSNVRNSQ